MTNDECKQHNNETKPISAPSPTRATRTLTEDTSPSYIDDLSQDRTGNGRTNDYLDIDLEAPVEAGSVVDGPMTSSLPTSSKNTIDPPPSKYELWRDECFDVLGGRVHFWIGVTAMFLIIVAGAIFFFMLIGAQSLCRPRTDCNPRNTIYNVSIQLLNVLFTYLATVSLPWRLANAVHLWQGSIRKSNKGLNLYGQPTEEIWFHIPQRRRRWMVLLLVGNSLTQYANQATRIVYHTYDLQNTAPGNIWTNVFFAASMIMAMVAGFWQLYEETKLRLQQPERFPPGPGGIIIQYWRQAMTVRRRPDMESTEAEVPGGQKPTESKETIPPQPICEGSDDEENKGLFQSLGKWFTSDKTSLNMWGL